MLPAMNPIGMPKHTTEQFGGYDARESSQGAVNMKNMSSDDFPYASSRQLRYKVTSPTSLTGFAAYDKIFYVDGTDFIYDGTVKGTVTAGAKLFASLNAYIIIMPDKKYYKPAADEFGSLEASWTGTVEFANGTLYGESATANAIKTTGTAFPFIAGDAVTISGCTTYPNNNQTSIIREVKAGSKELYFYENIFDVGAEAGTVTLARTVPAMDYICECNNRLWGCKGDTIYASALGDPKNFNKFDGVATDSYSVDVGSAGDFTACYSYLGYPIFFKEETIYKVYGSKPSNYEAMSSASLGVASGSHKSLAIAGEVLYYLSRAGVMAYTGGIPENISAPFNGVHYANAVGGSDGIKYYISMYDTAWHLFVYDARFNTWHREDSLQAVGFGWLQRLYIATATGIWVYGAITGGTAETGFTWLYETSDLYEGDVNKKSVTKLLIRVEVGTNSTCKAEVSYDGGSYMTVATLTAGAKRSAYLPLIPRRADHYSLKLSGTGEVTLYSITRETAHGSAN